MKKYVCSACGYVYEGDIPFGEQSEDYVCPLCAAAKSEFEENE